MKISLLLNSVLSLTLAGTLFVSCKKKDSDQPGGTKLQVGTSYTKNGNYLHNSEETSVTVNSGDRISFEINVSSKNESGKWSLKEQVASIELTRENALGTQTGILIPIDILESGQSYPEPVTIDTKYTFVLTTKSGEKERVGPIEVKAVNTNTIISNQSIVVTETNTAFQSNNFVAPLTPQSNLTGLTYYTTATPNRIFNPKFALCFPYYNVSSGKTLLVSASELSAKNAFANLTASYQNFVKVDLKLLNNSVLENAFNSNAISYASIDTLSFQNSFTEVEAALNKLFIFKTPEGKKGIGKFTSVQSNKLELLIACQK